MNCFDPNKVYIIGCMIDSGARTNQFLYASYGQAKKDGIECLRFPLERHFQASGSKNLNMNHVFQILLNLYHNGSDWNQALKDSLPSRKVNRYLDSDDETEQREFTQLFKTNELFRNKS
jgi:hypothetical protein